jgi:hypothetical protein
MRQSLRRFEFLSGSPAKGRLDGHRFGGPPDVSRVGSIGRVTSMVRLPFAEHSATAHGGCLPFAAAITATSHPNTTLPRRPVMVPRILPVIIAKRPRPRMGRLPSGAQIVRFEWGGIFASRRISRGQYVTCSLEGSRLLAFHPDRAPKRNRVAALRGRSSARVVGDESKTFCNARTHQMVHVAPLHSPYLAMTSASPFRNGSHLSMVSIGPMAS